MWHYVGQFVELCGIMWSGTSTSLFTRITVVDKNEGQLVYKPLFPPEKLFWLFPVFHSSHEMRWYFSLTLSPGLPNQQGRQTFQSEGASFVQSCSIPCLILTSLTTMMRQEISNHFQVLLIDWSCINILMNIIYCCKLQLNEFILGLWISKI
jgi:hypothetical protein